MKNKIFSLLIMLLLIAPVVEVVAQINPQNLSNVRVDDLTDEQIRSMIRQGEAQGLNEQQLQQTALARGMQPAEINKLRVRIEKIQQTDQKMGLTGKTDATQRTDNTRMLNYIPDTVAAESKTEDGKTVVSDPRSRIFGADLFSNKALTFEPNLNMATPQNYVIGPNDQLLIDIYGNSEASYNLNVTSEGNINIEYVGIIPVAGLTIEAATSRIRSKMSAVYPGLRSGSTNLNVALGNIRSIKVILTGEIQKPGTYTLPSLANVFNALYSSGGPTVNGSFRSVELIRGGKKIANVDVYDFLLKGVLSNNLRLQDQDIVRVPVYKSRIEIVGEVKRPGIFELLEGETVSDLLRFAGDFSEKAYKARIKVLKNTSTERSIADVTVDQFQSYKPNSGDRFFVDQILDRFANQVRIEGAVFRPGQYELEPGLRLSTLIRKAEGIREDAFTQRGYITRLKPDNQLEMISFDVAGVLNGTSPDVNLLREDVVVITSIFDLKEEYNVRIDGEVRAPGTFGFAENMTLEELVLKAGGFTEGATSKRVEVSRRIRNSNVSSTSATTAEVFQIDIDPQLKFSTTKFTLQPFDIVSVRSSLGYEVQQQVKVEGEVLYPGMYTIVNRDERVSDLLRRAGGTTALAYVKGASLKREGPKSIDKNAIDPRDEEQDKLIKFQRLQATAKDSIDIAKQAEILKNVYVGIDLEKILTEPKTRIDLILQDGDILRIPKQLQTVKVNGEVLYPVTTVYGKGRGFKSYISDGGGFSNRSLKRRSYVIYANGSVKSTSKVLFFNSYPRIEPGAEIFVPKKDAPQKLSAQELLSVTTGIASLGAIILGLLNLAK